MELTNFNMSDEELLEINGGGFDPKGWVIGQILTAAVKYGPKIIKDSAYTPMDTHAKNSSYVQYRGRPM